METNAKIITRTHEHTPKSKNKWVQCIQRMYDEIQFCVNWSYEEVTEPMIQETGVRQGSNLAPSH